MITFSVKNWKDEEQLAGRIADIVGKSEGCPPFKNEDKWVLNCSNDWWLEFYGEMAELRCRYYKTEEQWNALKIVIDMLL